MVLSRFFWVVVASLGAGASALGNVSASSSSGFSCLNEDGDAVDYWYVMKGPNGADSWILEDGASSFKAGEAMTSSKNAVVRTLAQVYGSLPSSHAYTMYNDETDEGKKSETRGHSKGVVLFDEAQGFWLIHSLPRYPARVSSGYAGLPDDTWGQSFVCVTLASSKLDDVGEQLMLHWPQHYDSSISDDMKAAAPNFASTLDDTKSTKTESKKSFSTLGSRSFVHYAKSAECDCELYEDIIAKDLGALRVESWMNGETTNKIPSSCKSDGFDEDVEDVDVVTIGDGNWTETKDHSKWAVDSKGTACVGDINRQYSQAKRGGGSLCYDKADVFAAFDKIAASVANPC